MADRLLLCKPFLPLPHFHSPKPLSVSTAPATMASFSPSKSESESSPLPPSLLVFSGGTAFNGVVEDLKKLTTRVAHVLPVSDDGGSTAEIVRVLGGPAVGDIRSRCLRLSDESTSEAVAVRRLLGHRLPLSSTDAKLEWYKIVEGNEGEEEGEHSLWRGVSKPYKETIRAFLVYFQHQVLMRSEEKFSFCNGRNTSKFPLEDGLTKIMEKFFTHAAHRNILILYWKLNFDFGRLINAFTSRNMMRTEKCTPANWNIIDGALTHQGIGNFFFAGARIFFQSLDAAIFLFSRVSEIPKESLVLPVISTNDRLTLGCELWDGTIIRGQNEISHPNGGSIGPVNKDRNSAPVFPSRIKRVFYMSSEGQNLLHEVFPKANPSVLAQLWSVDCIVYAMGSLFTSLCPSLVLNDIGEIISSRSCPKVLLLNGSHDRETSGFSASCFVTSITDSLNRIYGNVDKCLKKVPSEYVNAILVPRDGAIAVDLDTLSEQGIYVVVTVDSVHDPKVGVIFDPKALIQALAELIRDWPSVGINEMNVRVH